MTEQKELNLEERIQETLMATLNDGTLEKIVREHVEKGFNKAIDHLFGSYGDLTKVIEKQVKSVLLPYLDGYDYSEYIVKLDAVLVEVLENTTLDNKKMLENFKELMIPEKDMKAIKMSELFDRWTKYVAKNVETHGLEICYDDEPTYCPVEVNYEVEFDDKRSWSNVEYGKIIFECEHDKDVNFIVKIHKWKNEKHWNIDYDRIHNINSLRYIGDFDILLMKLKQSHVDLILDEECGEDEVTPEQKPEATFE